MYIFLLLFTALRKNSNVSHTSAVNYATGLVIVNAATILFSGQVFMLTSQIGMKVRVAMCSVIYRKVLVFFMEKMRILFKVCLNFKCNLCQDKRHTFRPQSLKYLE